jgi:magnesium transporter
VSNPVPRCPANTRLYLKGKVVAEGFGADQIAARLSEHPDAVLWLDLFDPDLDDLKAVQDEFHLHPLAVEDAVHDHQRPKIDRYPGHLFMNVYSVRVRTDGDMPELHKTEISSFITGRALITVHKSAGNLRTLTDRWDAEPELAEFGDLGFLVYGLLDSVVDGQFAAARTLDEAMDDAEDALLGEGGAPRGIRRYSFGLRRTLANLRRVVAPMPDVLNSFLKLDSQLVDERLSPYFRDIDDHVRRANETIESAGDRINALIGADLNEQSNQLNDVTRKLAAWAAIIAVPTALTGYFGQNVPYPGYEKWWGFLISTAAIVITATGLWAYLKHRKWI